MKSALLLSISLLMPLTSFAGKIGDATLTGGLLSWIPGSVEALPFTSGWCGKKEVSIKNKQGFIENDRVNAVRAHISKIKVKYKLGREDDAPEGEAEFDGGLFGDDNLAKGEKFGPFTIFNGQEVCVKKVEVHGRSVAPEQRDNDESSVRIDVYVD